MEYIFDYNVFKAHQEFYNKRELELLETMIKENTLFPSVIYSDMNKEEKVLEQWLPVLAYDAEDNPIFYKDKIVINASDRLSAMAQFTLMGISFTNVVRYVSSDKIFL